MPIAQLPKGELVFVTKDVNGPSDWFYDALEQKYWRKDGDGNFMARVSGKYLPDPDKLWADKLSRFQNPSQDEKDALKPQQATFTLWEHWQGVLNAN